MKILKKIDNATVDYAAEAVPVDHRRGPFALFMVWFVVMINLIFIFFGVNISRGMALDEAILVCLAAQTLAGFILALTAIFSAKISLPAGQLLPYVFGKKPAAVITFFIGLMGIAWFGFQLELFSQSLSRLLGLEGETIQWVVVAGGLLMLTSGIIGFKAIDYLSRVATPLLLILLAFPTVEYFLNGGTWDYLLNKPVLDENKMAFGTAVSILLGGLAVPIIITADIMRYARTATQSFWTTWGAQTIGAVGIIILAIFLGRVSNEPDFISIIAAAGFGGLGLILVMLATWTTNDTNIYISSLAFANLFKAVKKWRIALVCGLLGILVGIFGVVEHFVQLLGLLGVFFGPAGAVFQVGIFQRLNQVDFTSEKHKKEYDITAIIAFVVGCVVSLMTNPVSNIGFGLLTLTTIPMIDGYLSAGLVYFVLSKVKIKSP